MTSSAALRACRLRKAWSSLIVYGSSHRALCAASWSCRVSHRRCIFASFCSSGPNAPQSVLTDILMMGYTVEIMSYFGWFCRVSTGLELGAQRSSFGRPGELILSPQRAHFESLESSFWVRILAQLRWNRSSTRASYLLSTQPKATHPRRNKSCLLRSSTCRASVAYISGDGGCEINYGFFWVVMLGFPRVWS